jgi:hypothetical protein
MIIPGWIAELEIATMRRLRHYVARFLELLVQVLENYLC